MGKPDVYEKKIPSLCRLVQFHSCPNEKKFSARFLKDAFKLETSLVGVGSLKKLV
jgi:hypothetical protein